MIIWMLMGAAVTQQGEIKHATYWMVAEAQCGTARDYMQEKHAELHWECYGIKVKPNVGINGRVDEPAPEGD